MLRTWAEMSSGSVIDLSHKTTMPVAYGGWDDGARRFNVQTKIIVELTDEAAPISRYIRSCFDARVPELGFASWWKSVIAKQASWPNGKDRCIRCVLAPIKLRKLPLA